MKKRKIKSNFSNYDDFLAIKKELQKNISKQEESIKNDVLNIGNIYAFFRKFSDKKKKKKNKTTDNPATLILNDLIVRFLEPYAKKNKQTQILLPVISLGISHFIINKLNAKLNNLFGKSQSS